MTFYGWSITGRANEQSLRLTILPIIPGDGLLFFDRIGHKLPLRLKNTIAYKNGMVELLYEIAKYIFSARVHFLIHESVRRCKSALRQPSGRGILLHGRMPVA